MDLEMKEAIGAIVRDIVDSYVFPLEGEEREKVVSVFIAYLGGGVQDIELKKNLELVIRENQDNMRMGIVEAIYLLAKGDVFSSKTALNMQKVLRSIRYVNAVLGKLRLKRKPIFVEEECTLKM